MSEVLEIYSINEIENTIDIPSDKWEGNCHAIATQMVEAGLVDGVVERGHWNGHVHVSSMFHGKPIIQHSWIRSVEGHIVDPTRWCFECCEPYVFIGEDEESYDTGGQCTKKGFLAALS